MPTIFSCSWFWKENNSFHYLMLKARCKVAKKQLRCSRETRGANASFWQLTGVRQISQTRVRQVEHIERCNSGLWRHLQTPPDQGSSQRFWLVLGLGRSMTMHFWKILMFCLNGLNKHHMLRSQKSLEVKSGGMNRNSGEPNTQMPS